MSLIQKRKRTSEIKLKAAFFLPDLRIGGAEHMMTVIASALVRRGYDIDFVLVKAKGGYLDKLDARIRVVDLKSPSTYHCLPRLIHYLRGNQPNAMISALDLSNLFAIIARMISGYPQKLFIRLDNTQSQTKRSPIKKWLEKFLINALYPSADGIIAVSKAVGEDFILFTKKSSKKLTVIFNPILNKAIMEKKNQPLDHPWFIHHDLPIILGIGRLSEQKNFPLLINAFANIHEQMPCRLIILGEGPERKRLESMVDSLVLSEHVLMPGIVSNPYNYLAKADLFVLSSNYEGLPTVLVEALACDCPVVSTDCLSGPREILDGGRFGKLVPVGDLERLVTAIGENLQKPPVVIDPKWLDQFEEEKIVDQYLELMKLPLNLHVSEVKGINE